MAYSRVVVFGDVLYKLKYQCNNTNDEYLSLQNIHDEIVDVTRGILYVLQSSSRLEPLCGDHITIFPSFQSWPEGMDLEAFENDKKLNIHPMAVVLAVYVHVQSSSSPASRYHGITRKRQRRVEEVGDSSDSEFSDNSIHLEKKVLPRPSKRLKNESGRAVPRIHKTSARKVKGSVSWLARLASFFFGETT
ncbi:PREDICTED: uncharacterized protein LOC109581157 isoform X2 [Amphimedon queenslandica]|uniref:Uncharacterized protein n=1 Tax=Amphimedon queenslandica TaxID=400682 RepID=A0A1X7V5I6_AMPQE|nr:PREDICTED: uncharacterized protein LOC109581157 isoform X2 [Amphimedon queenslandica]|eukprot:XP_019850559.1 PREDICTED: uncharacterized protein LOC109581157 isoform X2 [Amphimedon queenslandica]